MFSGKQIAVLAGLLAAVLGGAGSAQALIVGTYVDANAESGGNTVDFAGGHDGTTDGWVGTNTNQWTERTDSTIKEGAYVLENNATTTVSAPEIETTITGLSPGSIYNIYVIYQTFNTTAGGATLPTNTDWHVDAGLTASGLTTFNSSNGTYTGTSVAPFINEREALVGQVSHVTSASVFVDDDLAVASHDNRSRYDGVAFEFAGFAPEPASLSMIALGGGMLLRRRRK